MGEDAGGSRLGACNDRGAGEQGGAIRGGSGGLSRGVEGTNLYSFSAPLGIDAVETLVFAVEAMERASGTVKLEEAILPNRKTLKELTMEAASYRAK
jgi:hypothetical protein